MNDPEPSLSRPSFFHADRCGRKIDACFAYLQRIGKGGRTRVWLPKESDALHPEWAAVREFDLLQEADNLVIDELEVTDLRRSMQAFQRMRSGGYRVAVLTLGHYTQSGGADDLLLLDERLQDEITRLIHFLYLGGESELRTTSARCALREEAWSCADALPHIAQTLAAQALFKPAQRRREERVFLDILQTLPQKHIVHDVAVGLALPDATKEKNWVYIAKGEQRASAFFAAIGACIGDVLNPQMRGYGDRLTDASRQWQRQSAQVLAA